MAQLYDRPTINKIQADLNEMYSPEICSENYWWDNNPSSDDLTPTRKIQLDTIAAREEIEKNALQILLTPFFTTVGAFVQHLALTSTLMFSNDELHII